MHAVAVGVSGGRPIAVSGDTEGKVRVRDLYSGRQLGPEMVFPAPVHAVAVIPGGRLVVGFGREVAALARC